MTTTPRSIDHVEFRCPKCNRTTWQLAAATVTHVCKKNRNRETTFNTTGKSNRK